MATMEFELSIAAAILLVAALYSSVGHGGASGYLAVMALAGIAPELTRPTALLLNIAVAAIAAFQFYRNGFFSWRTLWPFAAASVPAAYLGGQIALPNAAYKIVLGLTLLVAAIRLGFRFSDSSELRRPPLAAALLIGAAIGFVSGLVGVGGGIFLTPLLLLCGWAETKTAAGVSAMFILVNSVAGIAANIAVVRDLPVTAFYWLAAAVVGGLIGSLLGTRRFNSQMLRRMLAIVLAVAAAKLLLI